MNQSQIQAQIIFPTLLKQIKVNINPRNTVKQLIGMVSQKFNIDFTSFEMIAKIKINNDRQRIPIDVPLLYTLEGFKLEALIL